MIQYQVLYWRDIPVQIKLFAGRRPRSHTLPGRFQLAIDRIAMQEGLVGTDAYLEQWHWSAKQECAGTPEDVLPALLRETEEEGDRILAAYKRS